MDAVIYIPKDIILNILSFSDIFVIFNALATSKDIQASITEKYPEIPRLMRTKPVRPLFDGMKLVRNGKLVHLIVIASNNKYLETVQFLMGGAADSVKAAFLPHTSALFRDKKVQERHLEFMGSFLSDDNIKDIVTYNLYVTELMNFSF